MTVTEIGSEDHHIHKSPIGNYGGAISFIIGIRMSILNSTLTNNKAKLSCGAINVNSGCVSISNSTIINCKAERTGGAICIREQ